MQIMLNNGTVADNVTPDELKRLEELGFIGKPMNQSSNVVTEVSGNPYPGMDNKKPLF